MPDGQWEQYPRFLDGVRAHTKPGDRIAIVVPSMTWDGVYSYAYYVPATSSPGVRSSRSSTALTRPIAFESRARRLPRRLAGPRARSDRRLAGRRRRSAEAPVIAALIAALTMTVVGVPVTVATDRSARGPLLLSLAFLYGSAATFTVARVMLLAQLLVRGEDAGCPGRLARRIVMAGCSSHRPPQRDDDALEAAIGAAVTRTWIPTCR
jgi:hypothetical protein